MTAAERCLKYRRRILEISQRVTAHVAPALSCVEILDCIYNELMRPQDVFVLSKGHGALAQYVILEERGLLNLDEFCNGSLGSHPDRGGPIAASTGSLGHGLGMAVGMAYAERLKGSDARVYVVMSDGELQEGSTWEAAQMAANLRLEIMLFVDLNDYGGLEKISTAHPAVYPVSEKWWSFGWQAHPVDGHDSDDLKRNSFPRYYPPTAMICKTVKGKGISYMLDAPIWHYRSPNPAEYALAMLELQ